jgi:hypothetical protein
MIHSHAFLKGLEDKLLCVVAYTGAASLEGLSGERSVGFLVRGESSQRFLEVFIESSHPGRILI